MKTLSIFLLITLMMGKCKKDENSIITVDVVFKEFYSGNPIRGLKVGLAKESFSLMGSPAVVFDTLITDEKGRIYKQFNRQENSYYLVDVQDRNYSSFVKINLIPYNPGDGSIRYDGVGKTYVVKRLVPMKLELHNSMKLYTSARISCTDGHSFYSGSFKDTSIYLKVLPEATNDISFMIYNKTSTGAYINGINDFQSLPVQKVDTFYHTYSH